MLPRFRIPSLVLKRLSLQLLACALTVAVVVFCVSLYANHGSISFRCGMLATASEPYLDNSNRLFQQCSWHLGIGTRTWGETYGIKVRRVYVSMYVTHINPFLTPGEAGEDR